jgi:hypothetical protein
MRANLAAFACDKVARKDALRALLNPRSEGPCKPPWARHGKLNRWPLTVSWISPLLLIALIEDQTSCPGSK